MIVLIFRTIKRQLEDTSSLVREVKSAPPSKKAMKRREKEITGAESLLSMPMAIEGLAPQLANLFTRNLSMKFPYLHKAPEEEEAEEALKPKKKLKSDEEEEEEEREETHIGEEQQPMEFGAEYEISQPQSPERFTQEEIATPAGLTAEPEEPEVRAEGPEYSDRTRKMHTFLQKNFGDRVEELSYLEMVAGKKRHVVVGTFFELLVLKSTKVVNVKQEKPYGDILVTKGRNFNQEMIVAS